MRRPPTENGVPTQDAAAEINVHLAPRDTAKSSHVRRAEQDALPGLEPRVKIVRHHVSAMVTTSGPETDRILRRAVPARGREFDTITRRWIVYASHLGRLVDALAAAGIEVVDIHPDTVVT